MKQKIRDALANLDVENDDQWTAEGMPRLDVVKEVVGTAVSRADITAAAKSFTRKTPNLDVEEAEQTGSGESADEAAASEETETAMSPGEEDEVEAELKAAQDALYKAQDRLRAAQAAMDAVVDAKVKAGAQQTTSHDIKAYQKSQQEQRERLARRRQHAAAAMAAAETQY